ncbi:MULTISPECIES: hypothetical protein [Roseivirga]|uniref:Viral A-type inclusion protein n=1 Tax=Roseivirga thermotolerans TaxID=1758176 RepID=A0ABQ3I401_9BACT|nr:MULTISPECIES: hypothetical protein [Roseivirga]MEC7753092.1 hypothetical protein [Bacteroidota bacterium]GHE51985.1 hypothetical protein GCM10011340_02770 [Roseivirga thermotolerans]|tara:strand:- start:10644 stop:11072 length:429 start_codon:yes stop_codon:yes gene_type:complete
MIVIKPLKYVSFILFFFLLVVGCGNAYNPKAQRDAIFKVHDEVMPKIGEVMELRRKALQKASEIAEKEADRAAQLRALAQQLEQANNGMMSWMREWSKNSQKYMEMKAGASEQVEYLKKEMERVTEVKEAINGAIAEAKKAL